MNANEKAAAAAISILPCATGYCAILAGMNIVALTALFAVTTFIALCAVVGLSIPPTH